VPNIPNGLPPPPQVELIELRSGRPYAPLLLVDVVAKARQKFGGEAAFLDRKQWVLWMLWVIGGRVEKGACTASPCRPHPTHNPAYPQPGNREGARVLSPLTPGTGTKSLLHSAAVAAAAAVPKHSFTPLTNARPIAFVHAHAPLLLLLHLLHILSRSKVRASKASLIKARTAEAQKELQRWRRREPMDWAEHAHAFRWRGWGGGAPAAPRAPCVRKLPQQRAGAGGGAHFM
jgi:hypothetical protein